MLGRVSSQDEVDQTMPQYVQQGCQSLKGPTQLHSRELASLKGGGRSTRTERQLHPPNCRLGIECGYMCLQSKLGETENYLHYGEDHIPSLARQAL